MKKPKLIAITGPSASGKSKLAVAVAKEINGEIISVDSRQIYKELNIGSAKPTLLERDGIEHHLIDIVSITEPFTAADFSDRADKVIKDILKRNKVPILAGGTGLYFRVSLQDFDLPRVAPNEELRKTLNQKDTVELYEMLSELDKISAEKIHCNNKVKIIRALEVCLTLKIPMSSAQRQKECKYDVLWFGLNCENRDFLYQRINARTDDMIKAGLVSEAKNLYEKYGENNILLNTIGYQEFIEYYKGTENLETAINRLKQNTRRYAKRQISWFKANKDIEWFDIEKLSLDEMKEKIINKYNKLLN